MVLTVEEEKALEEKSELLKAISHPVRLCIVRRLIKEGSHNVTEMQKCLDAPQSTVSQHLAKLKNAGIIKGERNGTEVTYSVVNNDIKKIIEVLFN